MGQLAYKAENGAIIEAFSVSNKDWDEICSAPLGSYLMPRTDWPAVPKTSIRGLRFFAHHAGYPDKLPSLKSYAHTRLQIDIVKTARQLGLRADIEVYGSTPCGTEWIADVLVESDIGKKVAFEVQLSSQHLDDFLKRTDRYKKCGIDVCWFLSENPVAERLCKALCYKNMAYYRETGNFLADDGDLLTLNLDFSNINSYPENLPSIRLGRGSYMKRLSLEKAIHGVMNGFPRWELPDWKWIEQ